MTYELLDEPTPVEVQITTDVEHTWLLEMADHEVVSWRFVADELPTELQESRQLFFPLRSNEPPVEATVGVGAVGAVDDEEDTNPSAAAGVTITQEPLPPVDPVRGRGSMQPPGLLERSGNPVLPSWAVEQGLQRYVILELLIDREGRIRDARPLQDVHAELENLAVPAVHGWTFSPGLAGDEPVGVYHNVSVQFDLPDGDRPGRP
jgi:hypothetical protein